MDGFGVLLVCTANICRSPLAEQLFRSRVTGAVRLSSAGVSARPGLPMHPDDAALSMRYGGDPSGHQSRRLDAALVQESGLILTATREHRAAVARLVPAAVRHTFTLLQFADLLTLVEDPIPAGMSGAEFVALVAGRRGYGPLRSAEDDDVPDPYGQGQDVHERAAELIGGAVGRIAPALSRLSFS